MGNSKKYIFSTLFIILFGEMYFYPYQDAFRFSAGVLAIGIILLYYTDIKELYLGFLSGVGVFIFRGIVSIFRYGSNFSELLKIDFPGAIYYTLFGILAYFLALRKNRDNPIRSISALFTIDIVSNLFESLLRQDLSLGLFQYMLVIAMFRAIFSYVIFAVLHNQEILILKKEHQKRYAQQNTIISTIQAEIFYLNKSMEDIEDVMSKSYRLYENNKDNKDVRDLALDIAREVHEIKKDYYRVVSGFKEFLQHFEENDSMSFKDISIIIQDNISRYLSQNKKNIDVSFSIRNNISIVQFYPIFTILNNLIINSIDASDINGKIQVLERVDSNNLLISVVDNGQGIDKGTLEYIFNPGFTTKFDEKTGEPSTGIGLSHIENIVEGLGGKVKVESEINKGTEIIVSLPIKSLKG